MLGRTWLPKEVCMMQFCTGSPLVTKFCAAADPQEVLLGITFSKLGQLQRCERSYHGDGKVTETANPHKL